MRWVLAFVLAIASWTGTAQAEDQPQFRAPAVTLLEAGIYCINHDGEKQLAPDTESGEINLLDGLPTLVSRTFVVPSAMGVSFGVVWAHELPGETEVDIRVTRPRPNGSGTRLDSWQALTEAGGATASLWTFEYPSELATGTWVFEGWVADDILWRATFEVVPLAELPGADQLCFSTIA